MFLTAPLLAIPLTKIRHIYTIKSFALPPMAIGLFAFCIVQGKNAPGSAGAFSTSSTLHGANLAWTMLSAINSCMGKTSTQTVNQTDLAQYARTARAPFWSQLIALPIGNTLCATLGIFATSSTHRAWGVLILAIMLSPSFAQRGDPCMSRQGTVRVATYRRDDMACMVVYDLV